MAGSWELRPMLAEVGVVRLELLSMLIEVEEESKGHPRVVWVIKIRNPPPINLLRTLLLKGVVEEDYLVLDPFCGQATTGIVAAELNCRFIGYDISQSFCRLSRRRLAEAYSV